MGEGSQFFPWIHIDDVCRIVLFAIENNEVEGIVNGVAPEVIFYYFLNLKHFSKFYCFSDNYPSLFCQEFC